MRRRPGPRLNTHHASRITHHVSRFTPPPQIRPPPGPRLNTHHASRITHHVSRFTPPMRKVTNIVVAGLGGQGVLKGTDILADVALRAGYDVKKSEIKGM